MSDPIDKTYMARIWPDCLKAEKATGLPAIVYAAVSAYETGWGRFSTILKAGAREDHFGLKVMKGVALRRAIGFAVVPTSEFVGGSRTKMMSAFAVYDSYLAGALDWYEWVTGRSGLDKYKGMPADIDGFLEQLMVRGYSTEQPGDKDGDEVSPGYAAQIRGVMARIRAQYAPAKDATTTVAMHDVTPGVVPDGPWPALPDLSLPGYVGKLNDPDQRFLAGGKQTPSTAPASKPATSTDAAALAKARQVWKLIADDPAVPREVVKAVRAWRDQLKATVEAGK